MSDFNVHVGFDTKALEKAKKDFENIALGGAGPAKASEGERATKATNIVAAGTSKALKVTGIIGIIASLAFISDSLAVLLGLFGVFLVSGIIEFYRDPSKALTKVALFIVNGIITGLEILVNTIRGVFGLGAVELPRFQLPLVEGAFDEYRAAVDKAKEDGVVTIEESFAASMGFLKNMKASFITNSEFQELVQQASQENSALTKTAFEESATFIDVIADGSRALADSAKSAFAAAIRALEEVKAEITRAEGFTGKTGSRALYDYRTRQSTTFTEQQASAGLIINRLFQENT